MNYETKNLPIGSIKESATNPRTFFDEEAVQELANSILEIGIIQPIVVRKKGKETFELVCGARRYRAAKLAKLEQIPATIRELTDDQAFDLQISENLQRKDVHAMDEAFALNKLRERGNSVDEMAKRLAKSTTFVLQRLKLNDLIEDLQKAFHAGKMKYTHAFDLCRISQKDQKAVFDQFFSSWKTPGFQLRGNIDHLIKNAVKDLTQVPWDVHQPFIFKKAPACSACPSNSANNELLFPEFAKESRCTNSGCFDQKLAAHMNLMLTRASENPNIIPLNESNWTSQTWVEAAKKSGLPKPLVNHSEYTELSNPQKPEIPNRSEFERDLADGDFEDVKEMEHAFNDAMDEYKEEMADYEKELMKYEDLLKNKNQLLGLHLSGSDLGKLVPIKLKKAKVAASGNALNGAGPNLEALHLQDEINRIQDREKRAKELDTEKVHKRLIELLSDDPRVTCAGPEALNELGPFEYHALCYVLYNQIGHDARKVAQKKFGIPDIGYDREAKVFFAIRKQDGKTLMNWLLRAAAFNLYKNSLPGGSDGMTIRAVIDSILPDFVVMQVQKGQDESRDRRIARVNSRLAALKKQKKELEATKPTPAKPAAKTPKKATKGLSKLIKA
jgi:ParB/RepB/Spo0J family partition protein